MLMKRTITLFGVATMALAATIAGLKAGSTAYVAEPMPSSNTPFTFLMSVVNGKPSGSYESGTLVRVVADAAPAGSEFAGWTGDIAILSNPFLPKTTAMIPYQDVTITATYAPSAAHIIPLIDPSWGG
jgi:hypothetical protein